jgi:acetyl-CoA C-acetyltransferase
MTEAVIVATARTPIGRAFKGSLISARPDDLAAFAVTEALKKVPGLDPHDLDDLMMGCGQPAGEAGFNIGRAVAVKLGFDFLPGTTVNRYCSSSLQTTRMAFHAIKTGEGNAFVSAGVEAVSRFGNGMADSESARNPFFNDAVARTAKTAEGASEWHDPREDGNVPDVYIAMGQTAENVALWKNVSREDMDEFACRSQNLAEKAIANGFWEREISPYTLEDGTVVSADDCPRAGVTVEGMAGLKAVSGRANGRITAGNACPLNDGAAALVVMSDEKAAQLGLTPLARIISTAVTGLSPEVMGHGPAEAIKLALKRANKTVDDIDLYEINEAFASQVLSTQRDVGIDIEKLNVSGGAIAVGHPFGMTGARITGTLINNLQTYDKTFGVESMCVGGGMGMAMVIERLS